MFMLYKLFESDSESIICQNKPIVNQLNKFYLAYAVMIGLRNFFIEMTSDM